MSIITFHGDISPNEIADGLRAHFNRGNLIVRQAGDRNHVVVQIGTRPRMSSGGQTALTVSMRKVEDGVSVEIGKQSWFGVVASLGVTALSMLRNPFMLIGRLDDLAQDIESMQLADEVVQVIDQAVKLSGSSLQISERLRRLTCDYCGTANPVGEPNCIACGAPLGKNQPSSCPNCGFVVSPAEVKCPNCGFLLDHLKAG
jgi:Double zinc ribbon